MKTSPIDAFDWLVNTDLQLIPGYLKGGRYRMSLSFTSKVTILKRKLLQFLIAMSYMYIVNCVVSVSIVTPHDNSYIQITKSNFLSIFPGQLALNLKCILFIVF